MNRRPPPVRESSNGTRYSITPVYLPLDRGPEEVHLEHHLTTGRVREAFNLEFLFIGLNECQKYLSVLF
jgi:hypothetical protein